MSYTPEDCNKIRFSAALDLMRFKTLCEIQKDNCRYVLDIDDVNEILITAGLPVIVPDEINEKEVKIIEAGKTQEDKNGQSVCS